MIERLKKMWPLLFLLLTLATLVACGPERGGSSGSDKCSDDNECRVTAYCDIDEGERSGRCRDREDMGNNANNGDPNNANNANNGGPNNGDPNNGDPNNVNNTTAMEIERCRGFCAEVAVCPELVELCGEEAAQIGQECQQVCGADVTLRERLLLVEGLPCDIISPVVVDSFELEARCVEVSDCRDETDCVPPGARCDGDVRASYPANGACVDGTCDYEGVEVREDCAESGASCALGECVVVDLCQGVECPAPNPSCDGDVLVDYSGSGVCAAETGACDYSGVETREACGDDGGTCEAGRCVAPDLCEGVECPIIGPACDGDVVTRTSGPGACVAETGACDYSDVEVRINCALSQEVCEAGACVEVDRCEGVSCPAPDPRCEASVAVDYSGSGACVAETGACDYSDVEIRTDCPLGCAQGQCLVAAGDTIYAIQDPNHAAPIGTNEDVTLEGVIVTARADGRLWVQEPGGGEYSGVYVEEGGLDISGLARGDRVDVTGFTSENAGDFALDGLTTVVASAITFISSGAAVVPYNLGVGEFLADPERWESVLVRLTALEVSNPNADGPDNDYGEFVVDGYNVRVDDLLYAITPDPVLGSTFTALTGILNYSFGAFKLEPRDIGDVEGYSSNFCDFQTCAARSAFCEGDTRVFDIGDGQCDDGSGTCDYSGVEVRTPCEGGTPICVGGSCVADDGGRLMLSEVMYNPDSFDDALEWIEIYNGTSGTINLAGYSLARAGTTYEAVADLSGTLPPGGCFVVGGPMSSDLNANPFFDLIFDFDPDLQNGGDLADAVALFDLPGDQIDGAIPVDAVIYGASENGNGLIDETGFANPPDVVSSSGGYTLERISRDTWRSQSSPTPNDCTLLGQ